MVASSSALSLVLPFLGKFHVSSHHDIIDAELDVASGNMSTVAGRLATAAVVGMRLTGQLRGGAVGDKQRIIKVDLPLKS